RGKVAGVFVRRVGLGGGGERGLGLVEAAGFARQAPEVEPRPAEARRACRQLAQEIEGLGLVPEPGQRAGEPPRRRRRTRVDLQGLALAALAPRRPELLARLVEELLAEVALAVVEHAFRDDEPLDPARERRALDERFAGVLFDPHHRAAAV